MGNGSSSSASSVSCPAGTNVSPLNINVKLADDTNMGNNNKTQNILPTTFASNIDINACPYTPTQLGKTNLPSKDNNAVIAKLYNSNKFIVNNITVNNSCNLIPRGLIIAFYGNTAPPPDGWALCDGTNCTPDLRGRSILGFDSLNNKNKIGQIGGEETHLLTIGEIPSHNHNYNLSSGDTSFISSLCGGGCGSSKVAAKSTNGVGHKTYVNQTTNIPHNNMPPFVVCSYIMKL